MILCKWEFIDYNLNMIEIRQAASFEKWISRLRDKRAKIVIVARLMRLAEGLLGDVESVGEGVSELRIHYGPGYRNCSPGPG